MDSASGMRREGDETERDVNSACVDDIQALDIEGIQEANSLRVTDLQQLVDTCINKITNDQEIMMKQLVQLSDVVSKSFVNFDNLNTMILQHGAAIDAVNSHISYLEGLLQ